MVCPITQGDHNKSRQTNYDKFVSYILRQRTMVKRSAFVYALVCLQAFWAKFTAWIRLMKQVGYQPLSYFTSMANKRCKRCKLLRQQLQQGCQNAANPIIRHALNKQRHIHRHLHGLNSRSPKQVAVTVYIDDRIENSPCNTNKGHTL